MLARAEAAEAENARVLGRLAKVKTQLDRFRAEEFWDRVMQQIAELLVKRGPLTPAEILPELRAVTLRGATLHKEPLTPGTLKKKMDVRVSFGRYFEPRDEGRYARKAGWGSGVRPFAPRPRTLNESCVPASEPVQRRASTLRASSSQKVVR